MLKETTTTATDGTGHRTWDLAIARPMLIHKGSYNSLNVQLDVEIRPVFDHTSTMCLVCMMAEFKIAVGHWPFSDQNWLFPTICKSIRSFSNHTKSTKWSYTFVNGQTLVGVFGHLSIPYFELCDGMYDGLLQLKCFQHCNLLCRTCNIQ